ncbi:MAG TPA: glycosyltransferase family 39 protein [Ktedonobacteraceae bacterium]|nr:glycosyltransferase family 39 protein [Ktedonobacteraceae bacterium]
MQRLKPFLPALSVFCLALLVRILYNLTVAHDYTPLNDSLAYQSIGFNVLDEHCFCLHPYITTVYRAPLWPWIIAGLSLIFGRENIYDRLFLCCIGSGTCVFIYLFARDLFARRIGLVAGLMASVYPALYIYDGWMYTESLYTFLLFAVCYNVLRIQRDEGRRKRLWIACGILLALLSLTRPNGIVVLAFVLAWTLVLIWRKLLRLQVLRNTGLAFLIACILIAPWTVRNYTVSHSFIPVANGDGTVLLGSYNDRTINSGTWINPLITSPAVLAPFPLYTCNAVCEVAREDASKSAALAWISSHTSALPQLLINRWLRFWTPNTHEADMPMHRFSSQLPAQIQLALSQNLPFVVIVMAALGLVVTLKRYWRELLFVYALLLLTIAQALIYYGSSRFRAPIEPILVLLSAGAIWWLTQSTPGTLLWRLRQHNKPKKLIDTSQSTDLQPSETI